MDAYLEEEEYDNLIYCIQNPNAKDQKVLLNVMETGILSDVKANRSKSARQTHMHLSIYATSNDTSNILTPLLSRFIQLKLPEYDLETFTEICQKLLSRKYDKDHETIQAIIQYVWEHTRDIREAIAIDVRINTYQYGDRVFTHDAVIHSGSNEVTLQYPSGLIDTGEFRICVKAMDYDESACNTGYNSEAKQAEHVFINMYTEAEERNLPKVDIDSQAQSQGQNNNQEQTTTIINCPPDSSCVIEQ